MTRCSICYTLLRGEEAKTTCPDCQQEYHQTCWSEIGGCGTYGCKRAAVAEKPAPAAAGAGWGDAKQCPACRMAIASNWLACHCGARFPWADPMTSAEYGEWMNRQARIKGSRILLTWMFILSLTVVLSPLTGGIAGFVAYSRRKLLAADGTYLAMGYGSAALAGVFLLLIAATKLGA